VRVTGERAGIETDARSVGVVAVTVTVGKVMTTLLTSVTVALAGAPTM